MMKVVTEKHITQVPFYSLTIGDVFMYNNLLFMKTEMVLNNQNRVVNAVRLDGKTTSFGEEMVIAIEGKFIVD